MFCICLVSDWAHGFKEKVEHTHSINPWAAELDASLTSCFSDFWFYYKWDFLAQELKILGRKEPDWGVWKCQGMLIRSSTVDQSGSQRCWVGRRKAHRKGLLESQRIWVTQRVSLPQGGHCALADGDMQCHVQEFLWTLCTPPLLSWLHLLREYSK